MMELIIFGILLIAVIAGAIALNKTGWFKGNVKPMKNEEMISHNQYRASSRYYDSN